MVNFCMPITHIDNGGVWVVNFEGLNFCGLESLDDFVDYCYGIQSTYVYECKFCG